jgi:hypothetical protein
MLALDAASATQGVAMLLPERSGDRRVQPFEVTAHRH